MLSGQSRTIQVEPIEVPTKVADVEREAPEPVAVEEAESVAEPVA